MTTTENSRADALTERVSQLEKALVYVGHHLHGTPQYMLCDGVSLIDNDGIIVKADGIDVAVSLSAASPIEQPAAAPIDEPKLAVWYGSMPESNGKSNWTAILHNGNIGRGITLDRSEYPDRVRYEADRARWLIGELAVEPSILDYDADKHSGFTAPSPADERAALPRYAEWLYLRAHGQWSNGVPDWARDHTGRMNDFTAANAVIEELAEARAASANETVAEGAADVREMLEQFGADDCREGSRAMGHSGPEDGKWEDYVEVPIAALERMRVALSRSPTMATEPVRAWETDDGRVISDEQKQQALRDGGASTSSVRPFSIALGRIGAVRAMAPEAVALPQPVLDALRFYANGHHFNIDEDHQQFDTVSGEPQNWLFSERDDDCTMIEDGRIAKAVLQGIAARFEEPPPPIEGEVFAAPQPAQADARPTDDELWDQTLRERDEYHEAADKLAAAIAKHFGVDIGEHSNANCPWDEALEVIENAPQPAAREVLTDEQREALQHAINAAEEDCAYTTATTLRTIIATHPRQPGQPERTDTHGWLRSGSLLYRLTDERHPQNRDEINVTMAGGSRADAGRIARAVQLLEFLSRQPEPRAEVTDCGCSTNEACKMKTDGSCWRAD